jgi:LPS export ABC transporter protein LptC
MKFLAVWTFIGIIFALAFEGIYKLQLKQLQKEVKSVPKAERVAYDMSFTYFNRGKPLWNFKGHKVDMSNPKEIEIEKFEAKNLENRLKAVSDKAIYNKSENLLTLSGNVNIYGETKNGKIHIKTDLFYIDLAKKIAYTPVNHKVVINEGCKTFVGNGLKYNIKTGEFKILKDVQTYLNCP